MPQRIGQRITQPFKQHEWRTKLVVFVVLGAAIILLAMIIETEPWRGILGNFAVTFLAVGLIGFLWDILGGDPLERRVDAIQSKMTLLADLTASNIGLERIWPNRKSWQKDPDAGLEDWHDLVCSAKQVDIVSNTFWHNWLHTSDFRTRFFEHIAQGASVRLLIYDLDSDVLLLRAKDENDREVRHVLEMQSEIGYSLITLYEEVKKIRARSGKEPEIRLTHKFLHYAQVIRADDRMLVAIYLSGKSGSPCPTIQLRGLHSAYFTTYAEQFKILWDRAKPVDFNELQRRAAQLGGLPSPPAEE